MEEPLAYANAMECKKERSYFARRVHKFALSIAAGEAARDTSGHPGE